MPLIGLSILLMFSEPLRAQCDFDVVHDKFDGHVTVMSKNKRLNGDSFIRAGMMISQGDTTFLISVSTSRDKIGCVVEDKSTGYFRLTSGQVLECIHMGKTDCDEFVTMAFIVTDDIKEFLKFNVTDIRLVGGSYRRDIEMKHPDYVRESIQCLKTAKIQ